MRVVAGRLRGRLLEAPAGAATRPTGARVKEALFSMLGELRGERVLDLYAGSGALGIEALSRGASFAVFVEAARPALTSLRQNIDKLGLASQAKVLPLRVESARAQLAANAPFDLVLCDPPWSDIAAARDQLEALTEAGLFAADVRIALEHSAKSPPIERGASLLEITDERRWGDTAIRFLARGT